MENFVLQQVLWTLALLFFVGISYFVVRVFTQLPFKPLRPLYEILLCVIVFCYFLAFRVNF